MRLTARYEAALVMATQLHADQLRKGTDIPYVTHLLSVSSLVLEHGGTEDQAIAALLHDAVEDQGGKETLDRIREQFGPEVADIVDHCTDAYEDPKPEWRQRKETYVAEITNMPASAALVSCADKLHNARAILSDLRNLGEDLWSRFTGKKEGTLWYYRSLVNAFDKVFQNRLTDELRRTVEEIETISLNSNLSAASTSSDSSRT
jgi:(p)ppGpp synthase/HD superfamily hydrolase